VERREFVGISEELANARSALNYEIKNNEVQMLNNMSLADPVP